MHYLVLISFLLIFPSKSISSSVSTPKLHALIDDLSRVGRVSNAIALQAGAHKIKFELVLLELLNIKATSLKDLAGLKTKEMSDFLQIFIDDNTGGVGFDSEKVNMQRMMYAFDRLARLVSDHMKKLEEIKKNTEIESNHYYFAIKTNTTIQKAVNVAIDETLVQSFRNMSKLWGKSFPTESDLNVFKIFGENPDKTKKDVANMIKVKTTLVDLLHLYNSTMLIATQTADLAEHYSGPTFASDLIETYAKTVQNITSQSRSRYFTDAGKLVSEALKSAGEIFKQTVNSHDHEYGDRVTWAAGFRSFEDGSKIKEDLKSAWFKEKVLKNKGDVSNLLSGLNPFLKVAEDMQKLGFSWNATVRQFDEIELKVREIQKEFEKIVNPPDFMITAGEVEKHTETLKECRKKGRNFTVPATLSNGFAQDSKLPRKLYHLGKELLEHIEFLESNANAKFEEGLKFIADYDWTASDAFKKFLPEFRKKPFSSKFESFVVATDIFITQFQKFQTLFNSSRNYQELSGTFRTHLADSRIFDFLECLKTNEFDEKKVYQINEHITTLYSLPNTDIMKTVDSFIQKISQVQVDISESYKKVGVMTTRGPFTHLITNFKDSMEKSQQLGRGLKALVEMEKVIDSKAALMKTVQLSRRTEELLANATSGIKLTWYYDPQMNFENMFTELEILEPLATAVLNVSVTKMMLIFDNANAIRGLGVTPSEVVKFAELLREEKQIEDAEHFENLTQLNLEFSSYSSDLIGAAVALRSIEYEFDIVFGLQNRTSTEKDEFSAPVEDESFSRVALAFICFAVMALLFLAALIGFGFTKTGKTQYTNLWLYYFGSKKAFDKRYRYALFMDTVNGHQVVCETAREMNAVTLQEALEKGAYVDAYSPFGNTALHLATREGFVDIVKVLIKHGADRTLLNHQNLTPEELIPSLTKTDKTDKTLTDTSTTKTTVTSKTTNTTRSEARDPQKLVAYQQIREIYDKYRKKKFRRRVPEKFPTMLFRIYATDSTDDNITNAFNDMFVSITLTEVENNITHIVVKTDEEDALVTSDVEVLMWVLRGAIIVRQEWMRDCLEDRKLIEHDERYLVRHLRFRDVLYKDAILPWSEAMAKRTMPYLQGVHIVFAMQSCPWFDTMEMVAEAHGATVWSDIPSKSRYNSNSHGYYHADKNCFWIVHDGTYDMSRWINDPDRIYTTMREDEFFTLLIKRDKRNRVTAKNPIPVLSGIMD